MSLVTAWMQTAGTIINAAAVEVGLDEVADPYASTLTHYKQLRGLLNQCGEELVNARDWKVLVSEMTITGDGVNSLFALPDDFARMVNGSGWRRADQEPLGNPLTSQEWQYLKAYSGSITMTVLHRIVGAQIQFYTVPALASEVKADYISRYWVASDGATAGDLLRPVDKDDTILFEPLLVKRLLKVKFLEAKGFDSAAAREEYRIAYEGAAAQEPGQVIHLGDRGGVPFVSPLNLPDTGFGS
jgi:hypothetical protein